MASKQTLEFLHKALGAAGAALSGRLAYVVFQVTRRCNLKCVFCDFYRSPTRPAAELGPVDVGIAAERLAELGRCVVCLSGGEPTCRRDLPELTSQVARFHLPTLITNGWFMTRDLARALFDAGMAEISVSIDYAAADRHDARRGIRGSWRRAMAALESAAREARRPVQTAYLSAVLLDDNLDDLEPLARLAGEAGAAFRVSLYSRLRGRARSPEPGVAARLLDLKRRTPHFVTPEAYLRRLDDALGAGVPGCLGGRMFAFVDAAGDLYRCVEQQDAPVGNLIATPASILRDRLACQAAARPCAACWTSTRGITEVVLARSRLAAGAELVASRFV